ncbi:MAG: putative cyclohex-ene-carboxylate:CoA ligase [Acidimicrobiia bacterium]|nr:putative cyclohex-ene-carboxylate:CoA ligase [Acidimicrobiia bacterium]
MGQTWWELIAQRADDSPDRVVLVDDLGRSLTFGQFHDRAERVAAALFARGVGAGSRVSWQLPTSVDACLLMAALARLNAVQNPVIPALRDAELRHILGQVGSTHLIVPAVWRGFDHEAMAKQLATEFPIDVLACSYPSAPDSEAFVLPEGDPAALPAYVPRSAEEPAWIYYSSGSTAAPKGAIHNDRSIIAISNGFVFNAQLRADDGFTVTFPITHIGGVGMLSACLRLGCRLVLCSNWDPVTTPQFLADAEATVLTSALPFFNAYLAAQRANGDKPFFPSVRVAFNGGAPLPPAIFYAMQKELGCSGVQSGWGLTECPTCTYASPDDPDWAQAETNGRINPGIELRVVGLDGVECGPGGEGELRVKGDQMFLGYVDPTLNADAFDEQGFLRTGDLGIVDEHGYVRITGRIKEIIIRNAENISTVEVENALTQHPKIAEVAVIGLPDERTGERCCAVVTLKPGVESLTLPEVFEHCMELKLAKYKVPEQLEIVESLPHSALGKVLKRDLQAQYRAR